MEGVTESFGCPCSGGARWAHKQGSRNIQCCCVRAGQEEEEDGQY